MNNEKTFTFTLGQDALNIIGAALGEMPLKISGPVVNELNRQIQEQIAPATKAAAQEGSVKEEG
jgi:hypothetical protein